ncbi:hypothetical protein [Xanthomonas prunicola]|jgi:hypothetical protein|uniref:hypothetical protein n=1 Tax=Xanthomonas prunicola TaxID=2053930 RepID=UPI00267F4DDA
MMLRHEARNQGRPAPSESINALPDLGDDALVHDERQHHLGAEEGHCEEAHCSAAA